MIVLTDYILQDRSRGNGKRKRYHLYCDSCGCSRGYGKKARAHKLCKKCMTRKDHLDECRQIAEQKGGKLLSTKWINSTAKYKFQCGCGHIWETYSYVVRRGSWCPKCSLISMAQKQRIKSIKYCRNLANSHGGECLSEEYTNDAAKYKWKCGQGHTWTTRLTVIEGGSWCPQCFTNNSRFRRREAQVREIVENIFSKPFPSVRPKWLVNPDTGYVMELDCYNDELKLAFEYDETI